MKFKFLLPILAVAALASCSSKKDVTPAEAQAEAQEVESLSLNGKWRLADYPGETEIVVLDSLQNYYLQFNEADNTFGLTTDCNAIGGEYKLSGDSLTFDNIASTLMACPEQKVENAMKTILPMVTTYVITPDSVLKLRADARTMATFTYVKE